ncbi:MAG: helix-hairpin-helix domain-containing protein [Planctomycetota bacterium]|jgi:hypothetical protein
MSHYRRQLSIITLLASLGAVALASPDDERIAFMEPGGLTLPGMTPTYRQVTDTDRLKKYRGWLENENARRALDLYAQARAVKRARGEAKSEMPPFHIALVPKGNHADCGFRLQTKAGVRDFLKVPYIKLDPNERSFGTTMFHESGHVVLSVLNDGNGIPTRKLASIPHTTTALTDRGTAFNEGFAIHLETLAAHLSEAAEMRQRYRHERMAFGDSNLRVSEYSRHAVDLATFSQDLARYQEVRDNNFAFVGAYREPDYLRVQLEKSRDFATLRNANQLLQSEGFYASFFFAYLMRGDAVPAPKVLADRQNMMLATLAEVFASQPITPDTPYMLHFVETHMRLFPDAAQEVVDVVLDLSHGVFVDAEAAKLWREHYLAALRLDLQVVRSDQIEQARSRWRQAVMKDPNVLYSLLGPQIPCVVSEVKVMLVAFGRAMPLSFDINTVQEGIIRLIPGISDAEVLRWLAERELRPFESVDDFKRRAALTTDCLAGMRF